MHRPSFVSAAVVGLSLSFAAQSHAESRDRDGFYLQGAIGLGLPYYSSSGVDSGSNPPFQESESSHGFGLTSSLLIGGAIRPGLVLGGGALAALSLNSTREITHDGQPFDQEHNGPWIAALVLAGPFVDYYPRASSGFHLQALVGPAYRGSVDSIGYGLTGGVGYDAWTTDNWSIGVLARLTFTDTPESTPFSGSELMIAPSLEATFAFH